MPGPEEITQLLVEHRNGNRDALDHPLPLVYDELRKIAARYIRSERQDHTLQPTALVHEALERLAELDEQQSKIVELRYFGGLSVEETAQVLGVSTPTVKRDWAMARSRLKRQLSGSSAP